MIDYNFHNAASWDSYSFEQILSSQAPTSIRFNPRKPVPKDNLLPISDGVPWCENGYYLYERPLFTLDPNLHAGAYYVQEASSMFIAQAFKHAKNLLPNQPIKVLDLCAAPGGKSTLIASLLEDTDLLISNEVIQSRANILEENITRWGQMNTWVINNDPKEIANSEMNFDIILIDAPCSGSGLWRREPKSMDEWSKGHVQLCADRQKRILADILPSLKPNGILIYSTCSYSVEENEEICDWISNTFKMDNLPLTLNNDWNIVTSQSKQSGNVGYRFYPWKIEGEGFFCAIFQNNNPENMSIPQDRIKSKKSSTGNNSLKEEANIWAEYLNTDFDLIKGGETTFALHPQHIHIFQEIKQKLKVKKAGTALGKLAHNGIVPTHDFAMSVFLNKKIPTVNVSLNEAISFLKKEAIKTNENIKGLHSITYNDQVLGWGKWMPNRMNNYLPSGLRIRMDVPDNI